MNLLNSTQAARFTVPLSVSVFDSKTATTPRAFGNPTWVQLMKAHARHSIRPAKDGKMLGGYPLTGTRNNANVPFRSIIQLDIDTTGTKNKATGRIISVVRSAPSVEQIRSAIEDFEWFAVSSRAGRAVPSSILPIR